MYESNHRKHIQRLGKRRGARRKRSIVSDETFVLKIFMFLSLGVFLVGLVLCVRQAIMPSSAYEHVRYQRNGIEVSPNNLRSGVTNFPYFGTSTLDIENYKPAGGGRYPEWAFGDTPYASTARIKKKSDALARERRVAIKNAMVHAWGGYKKYAFGMDELQPISGTGNERWGGIGTILVDSLDTLWLMGLKTEFYEARDWVRDELSYDIDKKVSVFETTIRSLGGLLSAYDWSGDQAFLDAATDLGDRLLKTFDSDSGLPQTSVNLHSGRAANTGGSNIAEMGTLQIEFRYLASATGNKEYAEKVESIFDALHELHPEDGLYLNDIRYVKGQAEFGKRGKLSFGGCGDSFYEYMLKLWLQGGKKETKYRYMYYESIEGMHKVLLQKSEPSGLNYLASIESSGAGNMQRGRVVHDMEHLACFTGGLLALGAHNDPLGADSERAQRDTRTAKALTYSCYQM